jgi:hypothetical protein
MRLLARKYFHRPMVGFISATTFVWPLMAAETTSIPDFSGIWGRNMLLFEPPSSGAGPIMNKIRRPDGTFEPLQRYFGDSTNPILRLQTAEVVKKNGELEFSGAALANPHNQCRPEPTPFTVIMQFGMQIIQQKDETTLLYLSDHQVRHVRMNVPHSTDPTPTWQGESVGHYEGDTLVIDTVGQKVGPLSMVDPYGTPYSDALRVIERYRLIDGTVARDLQFQHERNYYASGSPFTNSYGRGDIDPDPSMQGLQVEITVDDPNVFTAPWSALVTLRHVLGDWPESVCAENTRAIGPWVMKTPEADKPDF